MSDTSPQKQLLQACLQGNIEQVRHLVREQKCNPVVRSEDEATALHIASQCGHTEIVRYFIDELNCDLEVRNKNRSTPLHFACGHGKYDVVRYLVDEKGCNMNITGNFQAAPIHYACQLGHIDIVRYLVEKGCNLNVRADRGMSPLHAACFSGKTDVVHYLIGENKCDIESKGDHECTPLFYACEAGRIDIVRYLIEQGCNRAARIDTDATALHHACAHGHLNVVKYLIDKQICDPWLQNKINETAMQVAIAKGQIEILKYFVEKFGIEEHNIFYLSTSFTLTLDSKISKTIEVSALHVACTHGHLPIVEYLVKQLKLDPGKKCCIECGTENTPLLAACSTGRLDIVQYLLLQTNAYLYSKLTNELSGACYGCHPNVVEYLIHNHKADPNHEGGKFDHGPLQLAISGGSEKEENLSQALEVMEILVSRGININRRNYLGDTALHAACKLDQPVFVQFLLSKKCDPTLLNKAKKTPLWTAHSAEVIKIFMRYTPTEVCERILSDDIEENKSLELLKCLIEEHKWDPNEKTSNEDTVLHLACKSDKAVIVKYLFSFEGISYDPCAKNRDNETPLQLTSSINIIKELIKHVDNAIVLLTNPLANEKDILELVKEIKRATLKNATDENGNTALHLACLTDRAEVVKYLLQKIHLSVNARNESNIVPIQLTKKSEIIRELIRYGANPTDLYHYYRMILGSSKQLQTAVKVCILGDSNAGKSALIASLNKDEWLNVVLSQNLSTLESDAGSGVTVRDFNSKLCGQGTVYDFVDDKILHEKYSELLTELSTAPLVIIIVINLNDKDSSIISSLQYWLKFVEHLPSSNNTIVIGSKSDCCTSRDVSETISILQERVDELSDVKCRDFISLNCCDHSSSDMARFKRSLVRVCNNARYSNALAFNAHCFQVYIVDKFRSHEAVTFHDILKKVEEDEKHMQENDPLFFLPQTKFQLKKLCTELHEKGQVVFLQHSDIEKSWIIFDKSPLVSNIERVIRRKDLYQIPSNNGVLQVSTIANLKVFKKYDSEMVFGLFSHLEYCKQVSDRKPFSSCHYFFPGLLDNHAPKSVWKHPDMHNHYCGWILHCVRQEQSFTSEFSQALILRLMLNSVVPLTNPEDNSASVKEKCTVWKGGLYQGYTSGVEILIHAHSDNKAITVLFRQEGQDIHVANYIEVRSNAISTIRECAKKLCPNVSTRECFIDPTEAREHPADKVTSELHGCMFDTCKLAVAAATTVLKPNLVNSLTGINPTSPQMLLHFEPYIDLPPAIVKEICNRNNPRYVCCLTDYFLFRLNHKIDKSFMLKEIFDIILKENAILETRYSVPDERKLFYKLKEWTNRDKVTYQQLHEILDRFSVFSGFDFLVCSP